MLSSYYLEVHTGTDYGRDTYDAAAGRLVGMCVTILSSADHMNALTHDAERESCHSEVEVNLETTPEGRELVAKVVVDIVAPQPVKLDKAKLTKLFKAHPVSDEWKGMKVYKKMIPQVPESFGKELPA